jgi:hypothetical protein
MHLDEGPRLPDSDHDPNHTLQVTAPLILTVSDGLGCDGCECCKLHRANPAADNNSEATIGG